MFVYWTKTPRSNKIRYSCVTYDQKWRWTSCPKLKQAAFCVKRLALKSRSWISLGRYDFDWGWDPPPNWFPVKMCIWLSSIFDSPCLGPHCVWEKGTAGCEPSLNPIHSDQRVPEACFCYCQGQFCVWVSVCWGAGRFCEGCGEGFYAVQLSPTCRYEVTRVLRFRNPSRGSSLIQSSEEVSIVPSKKTWTV